MNECADLFDEFTNYSCLNLKICPEFVVKVKECKTKFDDYTKKFEDLPISLNNGDNQTQFIFQRMKNLFLEEIRSFSIQINTLVDRIHPYENEACEEYKFNEVNEIEIINKRTKQILVTTDSGYRSNYDRLINFTIEDESSSDSVISEEEEDDKNEINKSEYNFYPQFCYVNNQVTVQGENLGATTQIKISSIICQIEGNKKRGQLTFTVPKVYGWVDVELIHKKNIVLIPQAIFVSIQEIH
ncbi:hypothetical protein EDI_314130 [Entamoeba dispar SAW760]|uniref:IPT/TIG domain-containing protein n=1 Tax=Entamoeba dispar (strain ATCC PRA-260 / SAW760) TaxID=370354 RepID=B0EH55_ENTDS|nr:uncharacterized protein EDI_314130 [Entamoeba dispar SAW760]EDR26152.1 hypothetical protein EDI_314130 [Entamoeba dispar SAW760]|eukprot:EDR26152.1 hypothetical protein EDI_314130 [Entamoeba dispar SAW760]